MSNSFKSMVAVLAGLLVVVVLSSVTDMVLEKTGIMQTEHFDNNACWLIGIVIVYRNIYSFVGCYLAARLAPNKPMRHAMILGFIGFALSIAGTIVMWDTPPHWYPMALVALALPSAWLGGKLSG